MDDTGSQWWQDEATDDGAASAGTAGADGAVPGPGGVGAVPDAVGDAVLVDGALAGDAAAVMGLWDRWSGGLWAMCASMLDDRSAADEVVVAAFSVGCERLWSLQAGGEVGPWLYAIALGEVRRRVRTSGPWPAVAGVPGAVVAGAGWVPWDGGDAGRWGDAGLAAAANLVGRAAAGLGTADREVLELTVCGRLDETAVARVLGVSAAAGHARVGRMIERLRAAAGALVVAEGDSGCEGLERLVRRRDGAWDVAWSDRVALHVVGCAACGEVAAASGAGAAVGAVLVSGAVVKAPGAVRDQVATGAPVWLAHPVRRPRWRRDGFPVSRRWPAVSGKVALAAGALALVAVLGVGATLVRSTGTTTTSTTAPTTVVTTTTTVPTTTTEATEATSTTVPTTTTEATTTTVPTTTSTTVATTTSTTVATTTSTSTSTTTSTTSTTTTTTTVPTTTSTTVP